MIGVGIRESSSDLLIQNCDEYYSYNELTGLAREGEGEHQRRDPWDLVVAALTRMKERSDVMRSDRMKQVMQEIDPTFDEKDAGFNRFSKFMLEAGKRGWYGSGAWRTGSTRSTSVPTRTFLPRSRRGSKPRPRRRWPRPRNRAGNARDVIAWSARQRVAVSRWPMPSPC